MSDADLSRPLAPCSLNFALAEITVTDASGTATIIPGTSAESSIIYEVHTPVELEEHEVRLTKQPYDPYPELRTCATYIVQTLSPGAIAAAKLQARTEEGFKPRYVEVEMMDYALPYEVSIETALRKDVAAVQATPNASRPKSRGSRESVTGNLSDARTDTTWTTGGRIQDSTPRSLQLHISQIPHVTRRAHDVMTLRRTVPWHGVQSDPGPAPGAPVAAITCTGALQSESIQRPRVRMCSRCAGTRPGPGPVDFGPDQMWVDARGIFFRSSASLYLGPTRPS